MPESPAIFTFRPPPTSRLSLLGRAGAFLLAATCLAVLLLALRLTPDPSGMGTHQGLGLSACDFARRTGIPCVTCGMTTSFAYFVRGRILASLYVQPMGTVLAALTAMAFWIALYVAASGRPLQRMLRFIPPRYYSLPLLVLAMLAWMWKIALHLSGHDGWGG